MHISPCYIIGPYGNMLDYMNLAQQIASRLWTYLQPNCEEQPRSMAVAVKRNVRHKRSTANGSVMQRKKNGRQGIYGRKRGTARATQLLREHGGRRLQATDRRSIEAPAEPSASDVQFNGLQGDGPHVGKESN